MSEDFTARATCEAYYKFENSGDLGEDNQNQIDLTNNNGVTQSATVPSGTYASPSATKSADFEYSSSQYLSAAHDDAQEMDNLTAFTALFWVKLESLGGGSTLVFWEMSHFGDNWQLALLPVYSPDHINFTFGGSSYNVEFVLSLDTWYFLAFTYSQTNDELRIYRGDESTQVSLFGSLEAVDKTGATWRDMYLGAETGGGPRFYMDGLMCEVAGFSEELSLAELQEIQEDGMEGGAAATILAQMLQQHGG